MQIIRIPSGIYAVNCYLLYSIDSLEGIVIDPGGDAETILKIIEENNIKVKSIILTHGHGDHIGGVADLKKELDVPLLVHKDDLILLQDEDMNLSRSMGMANLDIKPDSLLNDGDIIRLDKIDIKVIHTPGHTPGGICLLSGKYLFSGDTLFKESIGRTDFPGGSFNDIIKSINDKLFVLEDDVVVLPGHGESTTILAEKTYNPFLH